MFFILYYSWAGLCFCVQGASFSPSACAAPFRRFDPRAVQVGFSISFVHMLPTLPGTVQPLCHNRRAVVDGAREHCLFFDFFTGTLYACLQEHSPTQKTLWVLQGWESLLGSELAFINHCGAERTMALHRAFILHASFICTPVGGILFTAPSGTGKSTQAALWQKHMGALVCNGDRAGLRCVSGCWEACGVPWCGSSEITGFHEVPLRAIVVLRQSPVNRVSPLSPPEQMKALLSEMTINPWSHALKAAASLAAADLCASVPVLRLECRPDEQAVRLLAQELEVPYGQ